MYEEIDHVEVVVRDLEESREFYQSILGFDFVKRVDMEEGSEIEALVYLKLGNTLLELLSVENPAGKNDDDWRIGYRAIAIEVDKMEASLEKLPEEVDVTWGPRDMGDFKRAEIEDPNGLPIELREWQS
jgi:glyoxylase I family protein